MTLIDHSEKVFIVRIFLTVLILILNLQTLSKADDISDFEIEGISVGDSALKFFSENEIKKNIKNWYQDKTYTYSAIAKNNFKLYDKVGFFYKTNDDNYKIVSLSAYLWCKKSITDCLNNQKKVKEDFSIIFKDLSQKDNVFNYPPSTDAGTKSKAIQTIFFFNNGDQVVIETKDWSKDSKYTDNFSINLDTKEFVIWLTNNS